MNRNVNEIEPGITVDSQAEYLRVGRKIEYLSVAWTSFEAVAGIVIGLFTGSVALMGFSIDSIIEVASSVVLLWRLTNHPHAEEREATAHRLVGIGFFALAAYICIDAVHDLITYSPPHASLIGIIYALASVIIMPLLARAKRRAAKPLASRALHADSHQSDLCAYLAVILLAGLSLNALLGWWWADPVAALCMLPIITREGISGLRGEACTHEHHG